MLQLVTTTRFRKDYKRIKKRGYDLSLLENVLDTLLREETLDQKYRDHAQSDWLLIYAINASELILTASRTGTHSDLFDE